MAYGDPPRVARLDPPPFSGRYLAEDNSAGWQIMEFDANRGIWQFRARGGSLLESYPFQWLDLPPPTEARD